MGMEGAGREGEGEMTERRGECGREERRQWEWKERGEKVKER